jgi:hypothetical protein
MRTAGQNAHQTSAVPPATGAIMANPAFAPVSTLLEGRMVQLGVRLDW